MEKLSGKVAIVTGAAQGLGAAFARVLAREGAQVVVGDIADTGPLCEDIRSGGGVCRGRWLDVTDPDSVQSFVTEAAGAQGRIDILVNNAALASALAPRAIRDIDNKEWDRVLTVNTRGVFECSKAVIPFMTAGAYGKIVNIASGTAIKGSPFMLHYVASKGAVIAMTRAMARELGDAGIRVNCIAPGLTMSEGMKNHPDWSATMKESNIATRALKREAMPDDLLGALIFLASPDSDFVTGQTLSVDGGSVMN